MRNKEFLEKQGDESLKSKKLQSALNEIITRIIQKKTEELSSEILLTLLKSIEPTEESSENFPDSIFNTKISPFESIVKYLVENKKYSYSKIAKILNRNPRTIWSTYKNASSKMPEQLDAASENKIPISIIASRQLSVLEAIVHHLRGKGLKLSQIASTLKRDPRTIWTIAKRAEKKLSNE
ncbi:MAG: hypothetical protein QXZ40_03600 [Candidatus Micrarchaeia archaeon]